MSFQDSLHRLRIAVGTRTASEGLQEAADALVRARDEAQAALDALGNVGDLEKRTSAAIEGKADVLGTVEGLVEQISSALETLETLTGQDYDDYVARSRFNGR